MRVALSVPLLYFAVIGFFRISGKRSTSQMNKFSMWGSGEPSACRRLGQQAA